MTDFEVAIVGGGHAGVELAASLRQRGFAGAVALLCEDAALPYDRPPLSKQLLAGSTSQDRLALRSESFYEQVGIDLLLGQPAVMLDPEGRLTLADGRTVSFARCVLATGAGARRLGLPGESLPGVFHLRSLADSLALRETLSPGARLVVIGGGFLGLEAASAARALGAEVTVVETAPLLMAGKVSKAVAAAFADLHRAAGIELRLATRVSRVLGESRAEGVETGEGERLAADAVLVAVGATPREQLAREAGLACDDGIIVDGTLRASRGAVFAIGDCARPGGQRRLESVHTAVSQARCLAAAFAGATPPAVRAPYFWSEQQGVKLQIAGCLDPALASEEVRVGEPPRGFAVYRLQEGRLATVEAVGQPAAFIRGQQLIGRATRAELPSST
ncbi:MAG: FAD-dependent oxidoreductase [Tistlia sp.]|uniref:NAD(P)/FAD-dependent oxidoreductase n=1 Tax=Tistlia sp. TaxID=3057121 RepID=UPI0034A14C75